MKKLNSILALAAVTLLLAGCGDKSGSSAQGTNSASASTNGFAGYVNGLGQARKAADKTIDVSYLNQALQLFNVQEGRYPKDLQELTPKYVAAIPALPAGFKLDYDAVKGEVKIVQQ